MEKILYSWIFNDSKNRSSLWYMIALSFVIWLSIWWFLTKQYWMSLTVLLLAWLIYFVENNSEDEIKVSLDESWIIISPIENNKEIWQKLYNYNNINWYSFVYESDNVVFLRLFMIKKWIKVLDLKIDKTILNEIENILPNYIEQQEKQILSFSEKIIRFLKL